MKMRNNPSLLIITFLITFNSLTKPSHQAPPNHRNFYYDQNNPRLQKAYIALQALKHAITQDPKNFTSNWCGPHVCNYTGVYCAPAPGDPYGALTVAGIDLNHADLTGTLPDELGLLTDLALFHINSNKFKGKIPYSFKTLTLLFELDVSNNRLSGGFPSVVLSLPSLRFLDLRYNRFSGDVPDRLFDLNLDAIFINNNGFRSALPQTLGNSKASVIVLANNHLNSCLPASVGNLRHTLNELIITNSGLKGCLPPELGFLDKLTVFDVSSNELVGPLPESIGKMRSLEQLNVAHNRLSGVIPPAICALPRLENFTYSFNYFCGEPESCLRLKDKDDRKNCIPHRPEQRSPEECAAFYKYPVDCGAFGYGCSFRSPPPPPVHRYGYP